MGFLRLSGRVSAKYSSRCQKNVKTTQTLFFWLSTVGLPPATVVLHFSDPENGRYPPWPETVKTSGLWPEKVKTSGRKR